MTRPTALAALLSLAATAAVAQPPEPTRLELSPAPAPVPALKYHLLPEVREQSPGNAAQLYYRAFSPEWFSVLRRDPKTAERLSELPPKPLRDLTPADWNGLTWVKNSKMLEEVDRAARRPYCDWEMTERFRAEGFSMLLPDVQAMRQFAACLQLRARLELLDGRYDKAARTLQTGFALGRHVATGPTLIQGLVGLACSAITLGAVEDWVSRPDAPNLYWALTDLPRPLVDLRTGYEGERLAVDSLLPGYREMLADPSLPPPSAEQLQKHLQSILAFATLAEGTSPGSPPLARRLAPLALALRDYAEAKRFLREHGRTAEQVEAMPVLHAVFLFQVHKYDVAYDDFRKGVGLPFLQAEANTLQAMGRFDPRESRRHGDLAGLLVPAIGRVHHSAARTDRRVAALRCVEAIRLHAAANGGKLPEKLADVTEVPVPADPWTGQPFDYRLEGGKATLAGLPPAGQQPGPINSIRYELTLRPAKGGK